MITALWIVSLLAAGVTAADQLRRPASEWTGADRDRSYWVGATVFGGLCCLGIVAAIVYVVAVVPRFTSTASDTAFRKSPMGPAIPPPYATTPVVPPPPVPAAEPAPAPPAPTLWAPPPSAAARPAEPPTEPLPQVPASRKLLIEFDDA